MILAGDRGLPTYDELKRKEPAYGCELAASTGAFYVDRSQCKRSDRYAREMIDYCERTRCLGDDRSLWDRTKAAAGGGRDWVAERLRLGHWINPARAPEVVGSVIAGMPAMSLGAGAAGHTADELAEALVSEGSSAALEDIVPGAEAVPKAYTPLALPDLIHSYEEAAKRAELLVK